VEFVGVGVVAVLGLGCDPTPAPADPWAPAARALRAEVEADHYDAWTEQVVESSSPHGAWSAIYADAHVEAAASGATRWPAGSTLVCEGRDAADSEAVSLKIMRRDHSGWLWAQYDADGEPTVYGTDAACAHCHAAGDDYVRSVALPE
jgi:Cytochrome P460